MDITEITCAKCRNHIYLTIAPVIGATLSQSYGSAVRIYPCQTCLEAEYKRGQEKKKRLAK